MDYISKLGQAISSISKDLPPGYRVEISLEREMCNVNLMHPNGANIEVRAANGVIAQVLEGVMASVVKIRGE